MLVDDIQHVVERLPSKVRKVVGEHGYGTFIAGGFVRAVIANEKPSDIDLFTKSKDDAKALRDELVGADGYSFDTDFAYSFMVQGHRVQVIHRWTFDSYDDLLNSFDFTIARAMVWCEDSEVGTWDGACGRLFYHDLAAKRLRYAMTDQSRHAVEIGGTLLRMVKFLRRGYSISPEHLAYIITHATSGQYDANGQPYHTPVDKETTQQLVDTLREIDPAGLPVTE